MQIYIVNTLVQHSNNIATYVHMRFILVQYKYNDDDDNDQIGTLIEPLV